MMQQEQERVVDFIALVDDHHRLARRPFVEKIISTADATRVAIRRAGGQGRQGRRQQQEMCVATKS